ncbi:hypothetical protein MUK42_23219 [Musa troglodytarum]|uniref:Uncharacterized protein n=1 Tax=Musa troglodytarum TaxID=320322 RepID=A0A9E7GHD4_9LILI|nr:hypothetical protein MUK42_23219 [Musa troglodytarum]
MLPSRTRVLYHSALHILAFIPEIKECSVQDTRICSYLPGLQASSLSDLCDQPCKEDNDQGDKGTRLVLEKFA